MIKVFIENELRNFEADIRDLCIAFFPLKKISYIKQWENEDVVEDDNDIVIKNYFSGSLEGERIKVKSEIKRQLYNYLKKVTGRTLLWGTLTGIRPVTIVTKMMEEYIYRENMGIDGKSVNRDLKINNFFGLSPITEINNPIYKMKEEIKRELENEYLISEEKTYELINIAYREIKILDRPEIKNFKDNYSIYVGVPFCKSTCLYCSFTSFNIDKYSLYVDKYLKSLETDFENRIKNLKLKEEGCLKFSPLTLYIGGGTPTSLDAKSFEKMLIIIDKFVDRENLVEYTIEAGRPDTIDYEKLSIMKKYGVTRISINPPSFNQKTLDIIGRKHKVSDVINKFKLARKMGFDNINIDIILGLPNEHYFDVLKTLFFVKMLKPDSFTVHSLALKRAARLNYELADWTKNYYLAGIDGIEKGNSNIVEGKRVIDKMFKATVKLAEKLKLKPYYLYRQKNMAGNLENVGYAKEGKECIYNIMMMSERHTVYGFGTATTKEVFYEGDNKRIENTEGYKSVIDYCKYTETL